MNKDQGLLLAVGVVGAFAAYSFYNRNKKSQIAKIAATPASEDTSGAVGCVRNYGESCSTSVPGDAPNIGGTIDCRGRCKKNIRKSFGSAIAPSRSRNIFSSRRMNTKQNLYTRQRARSTAAKKEWCKSIHQGDLAPCGRWDATTIKA